MFSVLQVTPRYVDFCDPFSYPDPTLNSRDLRDPFYRLHNLNGELDIGLYRNRKINAGDGNKFAVSCNNSNNEDCSVKNNAPVGSVEGIPARLTLDLDALLPATLPNNPAGVGAWNDHNWQDRCLQERRYACTCTLM